MTNMGGQFKDGPWTEEPDQASFSACGLPCRLLRGEVGAWLGYVGVERGHPWHRKGYDDLSVSVHGGLTFSGYLPAQPAEAPRLWWLGFDCGHGGDMIPLWTNNDFSKIRRLMMRLTPDWRYRDQAYATRQCRRVAVQAMKAAEKRSAKVKG